MQTRRQFLQESAFLAGVMGLNGGLIDSIRRASAIEPAQGTSYLDAEHIVVLMQENRSFDHMYGTLSGVRGFNDPRATIMPDGNPVWAQADAKGNRHTPFHLNIKDSKTTWMGCLPHSWSDQVDAANGGFHDRWLQVKRSGNPKYADLPLTMGFHTRDDIPFYYALADAFTVCDQNFCSVLSSTTPNRLHLMTGTIRAKPDPDSPVLIRNSDCDYGSFTNWKTFPERLEDHSVSWKIYQNELTVPTGLSGEADPWVSNFGCSPIEWFSQYNVRFHPGHRDFLQRTINSLTQQIEKVSQQLVAVTGDGAGKLKAELAKLTASLERHQHDLTEFSAENFAKLTPYEKSLHARAFSTNAGDPHYRDVQEMTYQLEGKKHATKVPQGDVLYQLRKDVNEGTLPTVSWIIPPERFSDHPCSPWYGQWYLSEILNILTSNPEVWKKTVFILTYDENDGYYDHVPPFQAPHPKQPETGLTSHGLDTTLEHLELEQDRQHNPRGAVRGNSIGLGFRVPLVVASPWSRGGCVCSQVFDHTSVLRFLENFVSHKAGKPVVEDNISAWRRTVCGDLTSVFQTSAQTDSGLKNFLDRDEFIEQVLRAQFQNVPDGFFPLTSEQIALIQQIHPDSPLPRQEPGTRVSCPLPYQLGADGTLNPDRTRFVIQLSAGKQRFGDRSAGAPFICYAETKDGLKVRHYALAAGESLEDSWPITDFDQGHYRVRIHGPNGFFREFAGSATDPQVEIHFEETVNPTRKFGSVAINVKGNADTPKTGIETRDNSYGNPPMRGTLSGNGTCALLFNTEDSQGWYDMTVTCEGATGFSKRYAGRFETGNWSVTDPAMATVAKR